MAPITAITQEHVLGISFPLTQPTPSIQYRLAPRHRLIQRVQMHKHLRKVCAGQKRLFPPLQTCLLLHRFTFRGAATAVLRIPILFRHLAFLGFCSIVFSFFLSLLLLLLFFTFRYFHHLVELADGSGGCFFLFLALRLFVLAKRWIQILSFNPLFHLKSSTRQNQSKLAENWRL